MYSPEIKLETSPYVVNILVSRSSEPGVHYNTRMFAPAAGVQEDHVCGSANCLTAPYWHKKIGLAATEEMLAKSVSARSGYLWITVDEARQKISMKGEVKEVAKGQLFVRGMCCWGSDDAP